MLYEVITNMIKGLDCKKPNFEAERSQIEDELDRFEIMAKYFDTVDKLIEYLDSNVDQFRAFFGAFKCNNDLDRALFFNEVYDLLYDEEYYLDIASIRAQLEWDNIYSYNFV